MRTIARGRGEVSEENLKDLRDEGIPGRSVFANQEQHSAHARRRMLSFFVVGWAAGTIGFVLFFLG